jgi:hypothetical protein
MLVDDAFDREIFVAGQDDELIRRCDGMLVLSQRQLDSAGAGRIVALADERHRLVRGTTPVVFQSGAALVVLLERFLVLLGSSKPLLGIRAHARQPTRPSGERLGDAKRPVLDLTLADTPFSVRLVTADIGRWRQWRLWTAPNTLR